MHFWKNYNAMFRLLWGIFIAGCIVFLGANLHVSKLQTNLFELLPGNSSDTVPSAVLDAYSERLSRKVAFLVSASSDPAAQVGADRVHAILSESRLFNAVQFKITEDQIKSIYSLYRPYRHVLLTDHDRQEILHDKNYLLNRLSSNLASPVAALNSDLLKDDPFLTYRAFLNSLPAGNPRIEIIDGYAMIQESDTSHVFISAELNGSPFDQAIQYRFDTLLQQVTDAIEPGAVSVEAHGVIRYATENRKLAQSEMMVIGTGSLFGILLIFVIVFRQSFRLLLILLPVLTGMIVAVSVSLLIFDNIHLISLVFGVSLIGVSIDYALHYSCANSNLTSFKDGNSALRAVRPALTIGLITSIAGYATLAMTDFPALRQMAVIAIAGLTAAYLTVVLWLPMMISQPLVIREPVRNLAIRLTTKVSSISKWPVWWPILLITVVMLVAGLLRSENDDIRMMRASLPQLDLVDSKFRDLLGEFPNSQYVLVAGDSPDEVLERERALLKHLRSNSGSELSGRYEALSDWLPSHQQQVRNLSLYTSLLDDQDFVSRFETMGLPMSLIDHYKTQTRLQGTEFLSIDRFMDSPPGRLKRDNWLGKIDAHYYSIVRLYGVDRLDVLSDKVSQAEQVYLIDRTTSISSVLGIYRQSIEKMFPIVLVVIFLIMIFRFGVSGAVRVLGTPVLAALLSFLMVILILGHYNLFTIFGLIITIAIAIDYAIFVYESKEGSSGTYLAISLAGITTVLAFGLLSLSDTPALMTFGLTLLFGIVFAYFLTPFIVKQGEK